MVKRTRKPKTVSEKILVPKTISQFDILSKIAGDAKKVKTLDQLSPIQCVRTRFTSFNRAVVLGGAPIGTTWTVHGPPGGGKGQPIETFKILTPTGWQYIKHMNVGDNIVSSDGQTYQLTGIYPKDKRVIYRVHFSDNTYVDCDDEHLWFTSTKKERTRSRYIRGPRPERNRIPTGKIGEGSVKNITDIFKTFKPNDHYIPINKPIIFENKKQLPLKPYLLGVLLGDKHHTLSFSNSESDIVHKVQTLLPYNDSISNISEQDKRIVGGATKTILQQLELYGCLSHEKFIPEIYLRSSINDRIQLLCGLTDTDGHVHEHGYYIEYSTSSPRLAEHVLDLVRGLGGIAKCTWRTPSYTYKGEKLTGKKSARISIFFNDASIIPISSEKHLNKWKHKTHKTYKSIINIEKQNPQQTCCISVNTPDHLYITNDYTLTHNTAFCLGVASSFVQQGHAAAYIDAEHALSKKWVDQLKTETKGILFARPDNFEGGFNLVDDWINNWKKARASGDIPEDRAFVIIVDTIHKLPPKREIKDLKSGNSSSGKGPAKGGDSMNKGWGMLRANMISTWIDHLTPLVSKNNIVFIAVAHEKEEQSQDWGKSEYRVKGGSALIYEAMVRTRIAQGKKIWEKIDGKNRIVGQEHTFSVEKNKVGHPHEFGHFYVGNGKGSYPAGFDLEREALHEAKLRGLIEQHGANYIIPTYDDVKFRGELKLIKFLRQNPIAFQEWCEYINDSIDDPDSYEYEDDEENTEEEE